MKKRINLLFGFVITVLFFTITKVDAVGVMNISMWANTSTAVVGNNVTYTVDLSASNGGKMSAWSYSMNCSSNLVWQSGSKPYEAAGTSTNGAITSQRFTFTYKTKSSGSGTCTFTVHSLPDYNDPNIAEMGGTRSKSVTVNLITQAQLEASYSKNNNLSGLSIEGYQLSPAFNKNTLEYSIELPNGVTSIKVIATKEDNKANVQGAGDVAVVEGLNRIEVKVTAQNGSLKTYILNVTVKELDPIVVKVDGKEYNVVRKKEQITAPNPTYTEKIIKINDLEVPAFENKKLGYTLVGLKDSDAKIELYIYNEKDKSYTLYREYNFKSSIICILDDKSKIPEGYTETTLKISKKQVTAYKLDKSSKFYLVYGINVETGEKNLYVYDSKEETIQRYNGDEIANNYNEKEELYQYIIIGLGSLLIVTYFILLIVIIKNSNKKKNEKMKKMSKSRAEVEEVKDEEDIKKDKEQEINDED